MRSQSYSVRNRCCTEQFGKERVMEMLRALALLLDWNPVCVVMKMCLCEACVYKRLSVVQERVLELFREVAGGCVGKGNWLVLCDFQASEPSPATA